MDSGIVSKCKGLDLLWPPMLFFEGKGTKYITQSAIESLCSAVAHRVVGRHVGLGNTSQMKELRDQLALEIGGPGDLLCCLIGAWASLVKLSVITRTSTDRCLLSSADQKSMHTSSIGAELLMLSNGAQAAGLGGFPTTHL